MAVTCCWQAEVKIITFACGGFRRVRNVSLTMLRQLSWGWRKRVLLSLLKVHFFTHESRRRFCSVKFKENMFLLRYDAVSCSTETMQVTPLRRTLVSSAYPEHASCRQQGHVGGKTVLQQNPPIINWGCWLMQLRKTGRHSRSGNFSNHWQLIT